MRKKNGLKEIQRINRQSSPDAPVPATETAQVFSINAEIKEKLKRSIATARAVRTLGVEHTP